ncbi:hypothetical protein [Nocardia jejuensis]|uniref:hypothetical protein n=1 Tax=Nocardia jejuensis TaxID=328049 RepID=UPI000A763E05|nr:hypothetical protein [Nocardia jejuensis]
MRVVRKGLRGRAGLGCAVLVAAAGLGLAGCSDPGDSSPTVVKGSGTVTVTTSPKGSATGTTAAPQANPGGAGGGQGAPGNSGGVPAARPGGGGQATVAEIGGEGPPPEHLGVDHYVKCTDKINYAGDPRSNAEINLLGEQNGGDCPAPVSATTSPATSAATTSTAATTTVAPTTTEAPKTTPPATTEAPVTTVATSEKPAA